MNLRRALAERLMPPGTFDALLEIRAAQAFGAQRTGRVNKAAWSKHGARAYQDEAFARLALIFRCVGVTAQSAAKASLRVYRELPNGRREPEMRHLLSPLLRRPNPQMPENRFLSIVFMMAATSGFCVIEKERALAGNILHLWPLESYRLTPVLQDRAPANWEYRIPGITKPITLNARDVIVYTYQDTPDLRPQGIGPIEVAFREAQLVNVMTDFLKDFFDKGAMPQHALILEADEMGAARDQEEIDSVKLGWMRRHGGLKRSIEPAVLEGIKSIERLGFDMNELAYQQLRNISDIAICNAFGVSPMLVDALVGMEHSTYSNKDDARKGFYDETITGLWDRLDDVLTLGLLDEYEPLGSPFVLGFDTSRIDALQDNRDTKAAWANAAASAGHISNHDYRREMGIPIPTTPDFYVRPISAVVVPVEDPLGIAAAEEAKAEKAEAAKLTAQLLAAKTDDAANADDENADDAMRALGAGPEIRALTARSIGPREKREAQAAVHRRTIGAIADKSTPPLRTYFREATTRILSQAERAAGIDFETRAVSEIDWQAELRFLEPVILGIFSMAGTEAYGLTGEQTGVTGLSFDLSNPKLEAARGLVGQDIVGIVETSRTQVENIVLDGTKAGLTVKEITDKLATTMEGWTRGRARMVARTESMRLYGHAQAAAMRDSGVVDRVQCFDNPEHTDAYAAEDGLTCATRDGFIAPLEDAEKHIRSEHPNGSLSLAPVLIGDE